MSKEDLAGAVLFIFDWDLPARPAPSYRDEGMTIENPHPIVANQEGRITHPIFLKRGDYWLEVRDAYGANFWALGIGVTKEVDQLLSEVSLIELLTSASDDPQIEEENRKTEERNG